MVRSPGRLAGAAALAAGVAGCIALPPGPITLNNEMADKLKEVSAAGDAFRRTLAPLRNNGNVNPEALDRDLAAATAKVRDAKNWGRWSSAPARSASAGALLKAYRDLMDVEEKIVNEDYTAIKAVVSDRNLITAQKAQRVDAILKDITKKETEPLAALEKAQAELAKDHKLEFK